MSTHKTTVDQEIVDSFLKDKFPSGISDFEMIVGGEGSQAYSFNADNKDYIIRINKHSALGFKKDEYTFKHYASDLIPIPKIYSIGNINENLHFCISEKVPGKIINLFSKEEIEKLIPDLFKVLDAIHASDISTTNGYGQWKEDGNGENKTWKEMLLSVDRFTKSEDGKPGMFETTFLEKDFWDRAYARFQELVEHCPEERFLIHGDYGFNNELSDGIKITGVIDWDRSMYGDFLYDLAWLSFWSHNLDYEKLYFEHITRKGIKIDDFDARVKCYKVFIGMMSMSFFAYSGQEEKYRKTKEKVNSLIF